MYKDPGKSSATDVREEFQLKKKAIPTSNTVGMRKKDWDKATDFNN